MAANWLEMLFMPSELNDQKVGYCSSVSLKWKNVSALNWNSPFGSAQLSSSRGGISGNVANPMRPSSVPIASVLRQSG